MNIDDIRCIIEYVILPVVSWLARGFARKPKPGSNQETIAADLDVPKTELESGAAVQKLVTRSAEPGGAVTAAQPAPAMALAAGGEAWTAYSSKQEVLSQTAATVLPAAKPQRARWVKDFGPGALGALFVTLGLLAYIYFSDADFTYEATQILLMGELVCLPGSLVMGAIFGAVGALLMKRLAQSLHFRDRVQAAAIPAASFISGALTGLLCDGYFAIAASL